MDTLDAVIDTVTAPVFAQGAWRNRGFSYAWLGLPEMIASEPSEALYTLLFAVAPRRIAPRDPFLVWRQGTLMSWEPYDWGFDTSGPIVPGFLHGETSMPDFQIGSAVLPLYAPTVAGEIVDLATPAPHRTLIMLADDELRWGDARMRMLEDALGECIARGDAIRLVLVPRLHEETAWSRRIGTVLRPHTDIVLRACEHWQSGDEGWEELFGAELQSPTSAILLDEQRRVLARIEGQGIFELFAERLQEALGVTPCTLVAPMSAAPLEPDRKTALNGPDPLRLERVAVIEEWDQGRPSRLWSERVDEVVAEVAVRAAVAMKQPSCVGIELAFPGDMDPAARARIDAVLANAGLERVGGEPLLHNDFEDHYRSAHYLEDPRGLFVLEPNDARIPAVTGALWESRVPFVWRTNGRRFELVCPERTVSWAQSVLAFSPLLAGMEKLELPADPAPPPLHRETKAHRVAILEGPGEAAAFERFHALHETPTAPWAVEVLAHPVAMLRITEVDDRSAWVRGKKLWYRFGYQLFGGVEEVELCPTSTFSLLTLAVATTKVRSLGHTDRTNPATWRLWEEELPLGWESGMGAYPFTSGYHHAEASRVLKEQPRVFGSLDCVEELEIGSAAPFLHGTLSDGEPADLARFLGRPVLLFFVLPGGMAQFDLLELARAYRDAEQQGEVPILIVKPAGTEMGDPLAAVPEVAKRALVLEQDEQQRDRTELDYGISGHVLYWPAGFLIDAEGRIAARIGANGVYWSFRDELRAALGLR